MTAPRWLTSTEMDAWLAFVETSLLMQRKIELQLREGGDISQVQYWVLTRLLDAPGKRRRMSELAENAVFSRSGLTYQVTQLEKARLVRREPCPDDDRGVVAVLTDEGERVLRRIAPGHVGVVRANFIDLLSESELLLLTKVLGRTRDRLRESDENGSTRDRTTASGSTGKRSGGRSQR